MLRLRSSRLPALVVCAALLHASGLAEPVAVRRTEGADHGFLVLRSVEGKILANCDQFQLASGNRVTKQLIFRFKDGSLYHETVVFSQRGHFRMLSYHLVEKGPAFKHPTEVQIDGTTGQFTAHATDDDGKMKDVNERLTLPADISNGLILTTVKNTEPDTPATVSLVVATPKPRIVKLHISSLGEDSFSTGTLSRKATHYVIKVEIGGVAGLVAPLMGKKPPDIHVWIARGEAPAFVKSEGPLYDGGPIWRIEFASPVFPQEPVPNSKNKDDSPQSKP